MDSSRFRLPYFCCLIVGCCGPAAQAGAAESLQTVEQTVADLSRVRAETAQLESDWRWQSQTLAATVDALKMRVEALEQRKTAAEARSLARNQETAALSAQIREARARLNDADQQARAVTGELLALRKWLPPRLSHALELPYRSLSDPALPASERMQHIATIWARCTQFNHSISCAEETLTIGDGANPRMLSVIYWGLSHGYALDRSRQTAYIGAPEGDGWTWREEPAITARVSQLIAIHQNQADPKFVAMPAGVTDPFQGRQP